MRLASVDDMLSGKESRYALVIGVAKRAREIIDGAEVYVSAKNRDNNKPVTIATQEVADEKITFRLLTQEEIDKKEEVIIEEHTTEEE
mgnify:CR=1 FL=1